MVLEPFGWEPVVVYRVTAWARWLLPLFMLEVLRLAKR